MLEARGQDPVDRPLASLNTARAVEGLAIRVTGAARAAGQPRLSSAAREDADALVRHLVRLEAGADFTLLENGAGAARLNTVVEVEVADGGVLPSRPHPGPRPRAAGGDRALRPAGPGEPVQVVHADRERAADPQRGGGGVHRRRRGGACGRGLRRRRRFSPRRHGVRDPWRG